MPRKLIPSISIQDMQLRDCKTVSLQESIVLFIFEVILDFGLKAFFKYLDKFNVVEKIVERIQIKIL